MGRTPKADHDADEARTCLSACCRQQAQCQTCPNFPLHHKLCSFSMIAALSTSSVYASLAPHGFVQAIVLAECCSRWMLALAMGQQWRLP